MDGEPTIYDLWNHPELNLYEFYSRPNRDGPWTLANTTGSSGMVSEVYWQGLEPLGSTIEQLFGAKASPNSDVQYFVAAAFPPVIRVKFNAVAGSQESFQTLRHIQFFGKFVDTYPETGELGLMGRKAYYTLIGAIRHRPDSESPDLVRFYDKAGLYITPPLSSEKKYVPRPYVSDNWLVGTPGYLYTLLYARTGQPVETGCHVDEFDYEDVVREREEIAAFFSKAERDLAEPQQRERCEGALGVLELMEQEDEMPVERRDLTDLLGDFNPNS
ncbi:hypothetical protein B0I37DRAFT_387494 [Chaetomium sp. MPI-CAGE-AT-0009]|nr:hypothetical protein B0I37DRAFT_387494 [Chaetomium sp. MPI-CAGE-AT-0009]